MRTKALPAAMMATLLAGGCASERALAPDVLGMTPTEAIQRAAAAAPGGIAGRFVMTVRATGRADGGRLYINSEADYRDQRNLSIAVAPWAEGGLLQRAGAREDGHLKGRRIAVHGVARRTTIHFTANGRPTGKYYYQTHVAVTRPQQVSFLD